MKEIKCKHCKKPKMVRTADVKRGWGLFCSKKCKASYQEKHTGQYKRYKELKDFVDHYVRADQFLPFHEENMEK